MSYDPDRHHRRSIRLKGYDYAQSGAYFVTIVTQRRACLFGQVTNGQMQLNDAGLVAKACWLAIPEHFPFVELDAFVIMPNHIHGIIVITDTGVGANNHSPRTVGANVGAGANDHSPRPSPFRSPSQTIGSIIRGFKIGVTKWFRANTDVYVVWQRNYYEHIIRDEPALQRIRYYIAANPVRWTDDSENPDAPGRRS